MNPEKPNLPDPNKKAPLKNPPGSKPVAPAVPPTPPLFRRIDWIAFGITTLLVFIGYFLTLAPDLTLEDSGELAVGSFYAGVPHPPGYPVWTIYTWLFTVLIPVSNIAYRVALSSAFAGALSCGLIALMVSRGSSMILESIVSLRNIERQKENWLCLVCGFAAGLCFGFNGFFWSQSVIVEVYTFGVLSFCLVLCLLLRWMYAPHQRRYLYWAMFMFGVSFTNHQTLIVGAMGIEIAVMLALPKLGRDLFFANSLIFFVGLWAKGAGKLTSFDSATPGQINPLFTIYLLIGFASIAGTIWLTIKTQKLLTEWKAVVILATVWILGAAFYFYMPLASMTNPPMNWGYPRTAEGFVHAFTRGQYEKTHPTDNLGRLKDQVVMYVESAGEEFTYVYLLIALVPFFFLRRMQSRERAWIIGLAAIWLFLAMLLMILLNPSTDRSSRDLTKVFFTASYVMVTMSIGYGLAIIGALLTTQYEKYRKWALGGGVIAAAVAIFLLNKSVEEIFAKRTSLTDLKLFFYGLTQVLSNGQNRVDIYPGIFLFLLAMAFLLILVIFRNKVRLGLLLVLFAILPTNLIISHWESNEQRDHRFGFWFGHDMFTPPFDVYPEMARDTVLFGGTDPGRFCPTYMIFCESFIPPEKKFDPKFDRRDVYLITQNALADGTYLSYIRAHYNRSTQIDPPFFQNFFAARGLGMVLAVGIGVLLFALFRPRFSIPIVLVAAVVLGVGIVALQKPTMIFLDKVFTNLGDRIEKRRRAEGVYPMKEIKTPSPEDSQRAFNEYLEDAQRRYQLNQMKPGEDFHIENGRVQVSGQVAVMSINGILTKMIFDANPDHEFYVEESFPLDWMYSYLTPSGIIMKINRQPLAEFTQEIVDKDHKFWSLYSDRLIGNWITYDTSVASICDFAERTYLHHDYKGFTGDRKFVRDDNAQKAFSKLRSSIGGIYAWRVANSKSPADQQRMIKEAEFSFKQSFAYCPYSPEAVYRYVNLLLSMQRLDDAIAIVQTCKKLDPDNTSIDGLLNQVLSMKNGATNAQSSQAGSMFNEAVRLLQNNQTNEAVQLLEQLTANPATDPVVIMKVAQAYVQLNMIPRAELALQRLVKSTPDNPETWYNLGGLQAAQGKVVATQALQKAFELSAIRSKKDPKAINLREHARTNDPNLNPIRNTPEFQNLFKK
ncbi:MAG: DUF2723 domain-containing protein [Verrucomicrobiota bacterium]